MRNAFSPQVHDHAATATISECDVQLDRRRALLVLGSAVGFVAGCSSDDETVPPSVGNAGTGSAAAGSGGAGAGGAASASTAWASGGTAMLAATYPDPFAGSLGNACSLTCFSTIGPCYASTLERRDISEGYPGLPVRLSLLVVDESCTPLEGVVVDIWHTRNSGLYSGDDTGLGFVFPGAPPGDAGAVGPGAATGSTDAGAGASDAGAPAAGNGPAPLPMGFSCTLEDEDALTHRFFRGTQTTDARGRVDFDTCYPGWYPGRALHIHYIVSRNGQEYVTSQLYFPEELTREILGAHPDYQSFGQPDTTNTTDTLFQGPEEVLGVQRQPDGVLLAYKTLVLRASLDTALCGSDFPGGPLPPGAD